MRILAARLALVTAAVLCIVASASAAPATVQWTANTDGVTTSYRVFWGTAPGTYDMSAVDGDPVVGVNNTTLVVDVTPGQIYYFMVKARSDSGELSPPSEEVPFTYFTDFTLTSSSSMIRRVHVIELRILVNAARVGKGLGVFSWTDPTITANSTAVRTEHITELRTALAQAYTAASKTPPTYTDPTLTAGTTPVKVVHLQEIRNAVYALYVP